MIDIHSHILPAVDDGNREITKCLDILEHAAAAGVTDIILTPHYIEGTKYNFDNYTKAQLMEILEIGKQRRGIEINLYLGNENYINPRLPQLLMGGQAMSLNSSRYVLVELPMGAEDISAKQTFFELMAQGYVPVLAHPERYTYIQRHPEKIEEYLELGCLMQGDYQSLFGKYGRAAKKCLSRLLKGGKIHFLASDTHEVSDKYRLSEAYRKVSRLAGDTAAEDLFENNPRRILQNEALA